ncbi:MAG: hypothetical protein QM784_32790 [Polyangiaceae bacterium]
MRTGPIPRVDKGLVGVHRWTTEPFDVDADTIRVGYEEAPLPEVNGARAQVGIVRGYELPVAQERPPLVFVELVLGSTVASVRDSLEQPERYRASSFVALGGHGFSLAAPAPFERYLAGLEDGNAMHRFTTTEEGEELLAAGHFVPVWGVHQWDYRLVFCRGHMPEEDCRLLGRRVLLPRRYPLDCSAPMDVWTFYGACLNCRMSTAAWIVVSSTFGPASTLSKSLDTRRVGTAWVSFRLTFSSFIRTTVQRRTKF